MASNLAAQLPFFSLQGPGSDEVTGVARGLRPLSHFFAQTSMAFPSKSRNMHL
jgi:hypothetical protein